MTSANRKRESWDVPTVILIFCVCIIASGIIAQTWWSIEQDKSLTLATAQKNSSLTVRILEEHANRILNEASHAAIAAAEEIQSKGESVLKDEASIRQILSNQRRDSPFLFAISAIDGQGTLWASSIRFPVERIAVGTQDHIAFLKLNANGTQKNVALGIPFKAKKTGQSLLPLARNVFDLSWRSIGQVQVDINLSYFEEFYERLAKDTGAHISLHNKNGGALVSVMAENLRAKSSQIDTSLAQNMQLNFVDGKKELSTIIDTKASNAESMNYTYLRMNDFPLTIAYGRELNSLLEEWRKRTEQKIFFTALTILITTLLAFLLFQKIRRLRGSQIKLSESERRYRMLFQDAQDGILLINRARKFIDANQVAHSMLGIPNKDKLLELDIKIFSSEHHNLQPIAATKMAEKIKKSVDAALKGKVQKFEWVTHRKGRERHSEVSMSRVEIANEFFVFCVMRDISLRKHAERLLQGQNQLLQLIGSSESLESILENTCRFVEKTNPHWHCGIQLLTEDQTVFTQTIGHLFPEGLKKQLRDMPVCYGNGVWSEAVLDSVPVWVTDIQHAASMEFVTQRSLLSKFSAVGSWPIMGKNGLLLGTLTLFSESAAQLSNEDYSLISIASDVSSIAIEGKRAEEKAIRLAHFDEITGLPNRFLFNQYLTKSLVYAESNRAGLAVLFLDLDRFKNINDTFDHAAGDRVLKNVAQRLKHCISGSDTIARVGGDEFMLLLDRYKSPRELTDIADSLLLAAAAPFEINGQELQLSASIGIAVYPEDGNDVQMLVKNADIAMYRAKHNGKNNYQFYAAEMNVHTIERLAYEAQLRHALDNREFVVHYQPKIDIRTGKISGAEALVRWNHPESGELLPASFIGLAEEAGLIGKIGMQVLDIACRDILAFCTASKNFGRIAINLSGTQFRDEFLVRELQKVVDFWKVDPSNIEFEITEGMVMQNHDQAIAHMDALKAAGFTLSIDDFGTGYSSLAYLKRFPVNSVKIDRSFIEDIPDDPNDTAIVLAIVAMAHTLGLKVIAEGVESEIQLQTLTECHCDEYQGFYFAKALPEAEFIAMLERS